MYYTTEFESEYLGFRFKILLSRGFRYIQVYLDNLSKSMREKAFDIKGAMCVERNREEAIFAIRDTKHKLPDLGAYVDDVILSLSELLAYAVLNKDYDDTEAECETFGNALEHAFEIIEYLYYGMDVIKIYNGGDIYENFT